MTLEQYTDDADYFAMGLCQFLPGGDCDVLRRVCGVIFRFANPTSQESA